MLSDLVKSGLLFRSGREHATTFRVAQPDERPLFAAESSRAALLDVAWVVLHQQGPLASAELATLLRLQAEEVRELLAELQRQGRINQTEPGCYRVEHCVVPLGAEYGWEAALMDHYRSVVSTMLNKLGSGARLASAQSVT